MGLMEEVLIDSVSELEKVLARFGSNVVYRGQTSNYLHENGQISLTTSFHRNGCVPPLMLKWSHYAQLIYRVGTGNDQPRLEHAQALLQHYGWRSFFLDFTSSSNVAAWFASNQFRGKRSIQLAEDCFEIPVHLDHFSATYEEGVANGHMYLVDLVELKKQNIDHVTLHPWTKDDGVLTRMDAQQAVLIGPIHGLLPEAVISCHIEAPSEVFRDFAKKSNEIRVTDVFPPRHLDPVLRLFLSAPWVRVGELLGIDAFRRGLDLPIYDQDFEKIYSPRNAFYSAFSIEQGIDEEEHEAFSSSRFFSVDEEIYYYRSDSTDDSRLKFMTGELRKYGSVVLEASGIIRRPEFYLDAEYDKGVYLKLHSQNLVEVCSVSVEHPGTRFSGIGVSRGWFYEIDDDCQWQRVPHADKCPCDNDFHHRHQFEVVRIYELIQKQGNSIA